MRWTKTAEFAAGLVVRPGLWQTLQNVASIAAAAVEHAVVVVSGLNPSWHLSQFAVSTIWRVSGVPTPLGTK